MSCVLMNAASITAAKAPMSPTGSSRVSTSGTAQLALDGLALDARRARSSTPAASAAKSGWCSTV